MLDGIKSYTATFSGQLDLHALADYALERVMSETAADAGAILYEQDGEISVLHSFGIRDAAKLTRRHAYPRNLYKGRSERTVSPG